MRDSCKFLGACVTLSRLNGWQLRPNSLHRIAIILFACSIANRAAEIQARANEPVHLFSGQFILRNIAAHETHVYIAVLGAGQALRIEVEQSGADVALSVLDSSAKKVGETDSPNDEWGPELLVFIAPASGEFRVLVNASRTNAPRPTYSLAVRGIRPASESDRLCSQAQREFDKGTEHYYNFEFESAVPLLESAWKLWHLAGEPSREALTLDILGQSYYQLSNARLARERLEQALSLVRDVKQERERARLLNMLGGVEEFAGDAQKALSLYGQALAINNHLRVLSGVIAVLNNLGGLYRSIGEIERAADYYSRSAHTAHSAHGYEEMEATALSNLGATYGQLGQLGAAVRAEQASLAIRVRKQFTAEEAISRNLLGEIYVLRAKFSQANHEFTKAREIFRDRRDVRRQASVLANLGFLEVRRKDPGAAIKRYKQALTLAASVHDVREQALILSRLAAAENLCDDLDAALVHSRQAIELAESARERMQSLDWRASLLASRRDVYEEHADILMRLYSERGSPDDLAGAFETSELARARSLLDNIPAVSRALLKDVPAELRTRRAEAQSKLQRKAVALTQTTSAPRIQQVEREIDELVSEIRAIDGEIRYSNPRYASVASYRPIGVTALRKEVLDNDTVLLEFLLGANRSYAWLASQSGFKGVPLPPRDQLATLARRFIKLISTPPANASAVEAIELEKLARLLRATLLAPFADSLRAKRLVIVADGPLQMLPFSAIINAGIRSPQAFAPMDIVVLPSASVLATARRENATRRRAARSIAVIADPVFDVEDPRVHVASTAMAHQTNPGASGTRPPARLPFAREESKGILRTFHPADAFEAFDFDASRATVLSDKLEKYRILHFATHAVVDDARPELSGITLSLIDENGRPQDGMVRLADIYTMHINADLVVLSSCRTAVGKETRGEGAAGLARGFLNAGARGVVASLWRVDDQATAELMKLFYAGMLGPRHLSPPEALRRAQYAVANMPRWRAPYYWAAFILIGEWRR